MPGALHPHNIDLSSEGRMGFDGDEAYDSVAIRKSGSLLLWIVALPPGLTSDDDPSEARSGTSARPHRRGDICSEVLKFVPGWVERPAAGEDYVAAAAELPMPACFAAR